MEFKNTNFFFKPGLDGETYWTRFAPLLQKAGVKWFDGFNVYGGNAIKKIYGGPEGYFNHRNVTKEWFVIDEDNRLSSVEDLTTFKSMYPFSDLLNTIKLNTTIDGWDFLENLLNSDDFFEPLIENETLKGKYIIFDDEALTSDVIETYRILISMGVKPFSVVHGGRHTIDSYINSYAYEIEDFIDRYGGAYFRIFGTYGTDGLVLDYGSVSRNDLDIDSVDDSRLIYFKDLLNTPNIDIDTIFGSLNEGLEDKIQLKSGDTLICHKPVIMEYDKTQIMTTKGKMYKIIRMKGSDSFYIKNDINEDHSFSLNPKDSAYYGEWFTPINQEINVDDFFDPLT